MDESSGHEDLEELNILKRQRVAQAKLEWRKVCMAIVFVAFAMISVIEFILILSYAGKSSTTAEVTIMEAYKALSSKKFVDLTHTFDDNIPHWTGAPRGKTSLLYWYQDGLDNLTGSMGQGFFIQEFCHIGQWGTHFDPPGHFIPGKRLVDAILPEEMFLPLVVIDVHHKVALDPDYTLQLQDVFDWESNHGTIPSQAFVAMRTDWSKRCRTVRLWRMLISTGLLTILDGVWRHFDFYMRKEILQPMPMKPQTQIQDLPQVKVIIHWKLMFSILIIIKLN